MAFGEVRPFIDYKDNDTAWIYPGKFDAAWKDKFKATIPIKYREPIYNFHTDSYGKAATRFSHWLVKAPFIGTAVELLKERWPDVESQDSRTASPKTKVPLPTKDAGSSNTQAELDFPKSKKVVTHEEWVAEVHRARNSGYADGLMEANKNLATRYSEGYIKGKIDGKREAQISRSDEAVIYNRAYQIGYQRASEMFSHINLGKPNGNSSPSSEPWQTLKVSADAPVEVIKASYKALMLLYHPDKNKSSTATAETQKINKAYQEAGKIKNF